MPSKIVINVKGDCGPKCMRTKKICSLIELYLYEVIAGRVSTEVLFVLPAENGIFRKTHGIPRNSAESAGFFQ